MQLPLVLPPPDMILKSNLKSGPFLRCFTLSLPQGFVFLVCLPGNLSTYPFIWLTPTFNLGCALNTTSFWKFSCPHAWVWCTIFMLPGHPVITLTGFKLPVYLPSSCSHHVAAIGLCHFDLLSRKNLLLTAISAVSWQPPAVYAFEICLSFQIKAMFFQVTPTNDCAQ